jgi:ankyrin repeat protein
MLSVSLTPSESWAHTVSPSTYPHTSNEPIAPSLSQPIDSPALIATLPLEVLSHIAQQLTDPASMHALRLTCHLFNDSVNNLQNRYGSWIKRAESATQTLCELLKNTAGEKVTLPSPYTAEWKIILSHQSMTDPLTLQDKIKKIYVTAWDWLRHPIVLNEQTHALKLMQIMLTLLPYIHNAEEYTDELWHHTFPHALFNRLGKVSLAESLPFIARHFPVNENSPAYHFIMAHCPEGAMDLPDLEKLKSDPTQAFLFFLLDKKLLAESCDKYKARVALLQKLVKQGINLEKTNAQGETILSYLSNCSKHANSRDPAVFEEALERMMQLAQVLLANGADCNAKSGEDMSILHYAIKGNMQKYVQYLVSHLPIDVNAVNRFGIKPLHQAITQKNVALVNTLLQHPHIDVNAATGFKDSPLHQALPHDLPIVKSLLQHPHVDVNALNCEGKAPLHRAIYWGNAPLVTALLEHSQIDANMPNSAGDRPLHQAVVQPPSVIRALLLHPHTDVNGINHAGNTPLHEAILQGKLPIVEILLSSPKTDVNARGSLGNTPLHNTVKHSYNNDNLAMLNALLRHPHIDVNKTNDNGISLFEQVVLENVGDETHPGGQKCIEYGKVKVIQTLIRCGKVHRATLLSVFNQMIKARQEEVINMILKHVKGPFIHEAFSFGLEKGQHDIAALLRKLYQAEQLTLKRTREEYELKAPLGCLTYKEPQKFYTKNV